MFSIIYNFNVKPSKIPEFISAWKGLTKLIYEHENSFGSRLHKSNKGHYIAYASWPNKETFENAGANLPKEKTDKYRNIMKQSCNSITREHELQLVEDLLKPSQFNK